MNLSIHTTLTAAIMVVSTVASAQDSHYWSLQFGPRASLLGGAVIGSVSDVSGTYYNPGGLSMADSLSFAVSTSLLERTTLKLEDGGGEGVDLGSSRSGVRPSMVAGTMGKNLLGKDVLAYSLISRVEGSQDLTAALILDESNELLAETDLTDLVGVTFFQGQYKDLWGGLSYSHAIGSHIGVGLTWYGAVRTQNRRRQSVVQKVRDDGSSISSLEMKGGSYSALRTLLKAGVFAAGGPVTGGISVTSPSLNVTGSGELGLDVSDFGSDTLALAASVQTGLPAEYKSPLSVGAGLSVKAGNIRLHASTEWYDSIDPYFAIKGEAFQPQVSDGSAVDVDAIHELDEVLNWAVAVEYAFSSRVTGYASYFTDNSGLTDNVEQSNLNVMPVDIQVVNFGADFSVGKPRLTLALGYGWGSKLDNAITDLLKERDADLEANLVFKSLRLLFGFEVGVH